MIHPGRFIPLEKIRAAAITVVMAIVVAGAATTVAGCSDSKDNRGSFTVTDYLGREVTITSAERIISTSIIPTAILCGLGVSSNIVGVSNDEGIYSEDPFVVGLTQDDFPQAVIDGIKSGKIADLGGMYHMSAETMASVESDIVISETYGSNQEIRNALDALGLTYAVIGGTNRLEGVFDGIRLIAKAVRKESTAERMISEMKSTIKKISDWCESIVDNELNGRKYNVALMMTATYAIGSDFLGGNVLEGIHVNNVFASVGRYAPVSKESIASADPDVIIYQNLGMGDGVTDSAEYVRSLYKDPVFEKINAARNGLIFATSGGARTAAAQANQGLVRAYAMYAMFVYKDHLTFEIPDVFDSGSYAEYTAKFWEMINP